MKDFWQALNEQLGYVFISGVPSEGFVQQINDMDSDYIHFVPSVNTDAAIGLATGAFISGIKACVILDNNDLELIQEKLRRLNSLLNISLIIITNGPKNPLNLKQFFEDWTELDSYVYDENNMAIIVV